MSDYLFYIDDSGTKEYAPPNFEYSRKGNTRYFCFGGVLIEHKESSIVGEKIKSLKTSYFGTDKVEIKSNWLRIPKEREKRYLDKFSITDKQLDIFVNSFYDLISSSQLLLVAAVVDKRHMKEDYGKEAWYPPAVAYDVLLQRIIQEKKYPDKVSVIIDDMTGSTSKQTPYKYNLIKQHAQLCKNGSPLRKGLDWRPLNKKNKFHNSKHSHHIQIADIIAYNVFRQFVEHGEVWEDKVIKNLSVYSWLNKLSNKFRHKSGRIQGYGIIKFPLRYRRPWGIKKSRTL